MDKVQIDGATLYHGDCLEAEFPPSSCVVTSPPYNLNKASSGGGSSKRSYDGWYPDDLPEREYQGWQRMVLSRLLESCGGSVFYNHRVRYAWHSRNKYRPVCNLYHPMQWLQDFPVWCEIIWHRKGTTGHGNGRFRLAEERIYQIGKPTVFHDMGYPNVWEILPERDSEHVCPFPIEIPWRCIQTCTNPGDVVLDPFMGSGTTAVAALELGRQFVGFEKDRAAFDYACARLNERASFKDLLTGGET